MQEGAILNEKHRQAYVALRPDDSKAGKDAKLNPKDDAEAAKLRDWMCANFFDVRTFGAVMSTGINCGQVKGPVQITLANSVEPIIPAEITVTRMAATNEAEKKKSAEGSDGDQRTENRTMGRKLIVFRHDNPLGNAPSHNLFDRVKIGRNVDGEFRPLDDRGLGNLPPARKFTDLIVSIDGHDLPKGVEILDLI